ncbi:nitroreductase/quinone reductase family protein [Microbacterium sp. CPCC 204701]|uniref:nitroreductase/quinone reductase family protein n=1 Tax=Microbacterium sp. CPCC 204701 TaxID=2493084 RepID=UPI000FD78E83|nr:nitroreductase/quinone reductase family protein [Microbacterium sp. CPCC 204701]
MLSYLLALLVSAALVAVVGFVVGVRTRNRRVLRFARAMQRDMVNPGALRAAGTTGSPWAIVRAPGRISGKTYDTPVGVQRVGDELYISLPYGEGAQWVRNVRAAGGATVIHDDHEIEATAPELVPIAGTPMAGVDRFAIAIFGITHALRLRAGSSMPVSAREA